MRGFPEDGDVFLVAESPPQPSHTQWTLVLPLRISSDSELADFHMLPSTERPWKRDCGLIIGVSLINLRLCPCVQRTGTGREGFRSCCLLLGRAGSLSACLPCGAKMPQKETRIGVRQGLAECSTCFSTSTAGKRLDYEWAQDRVHQADGPA